MPSADLSLEQWIGLVLGPYGALVVMALWIWSLRKLNADLRERNSQLSERLLRSTESNLLEQSKREERFMVVHASTVKSMFAWLESTLSATLTELRGSSRK
jgi:hypothetical protein